ncbi:MAG: hypothetical protein MJY59_04195 [Bacteroidaceae bacterium]|nr:hypothetical protein [Bacteroidaceae bacterium]
MTIAVDFDGTIVEHRYPEIGRERPYATQVLRMLIAERHKLILWTMRDGKLLDDALAWCRARGVEFYAVNSDCSDRFGDDRDRRLSCKLNADIFIDDRNIGGLPSWTTIYEIIHSGRSWEDIISRQVTERLTEPTPPQPRWKFWKK